MATLIHDAGEIRAPLGRLRDVAGPQRVHVEGSGIRASLQLNDEIGAATHG